MRVLGFLLILALSAETSDESKKKNSPEQYNYSIEIRELMKLVVNSIYRHKEVFLRELISNCVDALNKVKHDAVTNPEILGEGDTKKLDITIIPDEDNDMLTIIDRGIGMSRDELVSNLGTIAHSGTLEYFEALEQAQKEAQARGEEAPANDLIGHFGIGFYSAFLVADKVEVISKRFGEKQHKWTSANAESFTIEEDDSEDLGRGTKVILHLKDGRYGNTSLVAYLVEKYSQFVGYPIFLRIEREGSYTYETRMVKKIKKVKDEDGKMVEKEVEEQELYPQAVYDFEQINKEPAIWLREPHVIVGDEDDDDDDEDALTADDYNSFFDRILQGACGGQPPLVTIHFHQEKDVVFKALLFVPPLRPLYRGRYSERIISRLRLYIKHVLVTEELNNFLPQYLTFVRGVIETEEIDSRSETITKEQEDEAEKSGRVGLHISREILQESRGLKMMARKITRRIIDSLVALSERARTDESDEDVEKFNRFQLLFGHEIKNGMIMDQENRPKLMKLLRFNTTYSPEIPVSLDDYVDRMERWYMNYDPNHFDEKDTKKRKQKMGITFLSLDINDENRGTSALMNSPLIKPYIAKGREVILLQDPFDEEVLVRMQEFRGYPIRTIHDQNGYGRLTSKSTIDKYNTKYKEALKWLKRILKEKVTEVEISPDFLEEPEGSSNSNEPVIPCVITQAFGGVSAGIGRRLKNDPLMTEELKARLSGKKLMLNPQNPLLERIDHAVKGLKKREVDQTWRKNNNETGEAKYQKEMEAIDRDWFKLEMIAHALCDAAMMNAGYDILNRYDYATRLYIILDTMTGLPHAPIFPDECELDFDYWMEKEMEEEREAKIELKEEKKRKFEEKALKKVMKEKGKSEAAIQKELEEIRRKHEEKKAKRREEKQKRLEAAEKKKREEEAKMADEAEEDIDDRTERLMKERKRRRELELKSRYASVGKDALTEEEEEELRRLNAQAKAAAKREKKGSPGSSPIHIETGDDDDDEE
ncbi:putative Heat shock protein HSP 90-alpha [Blattamonas nauphoetae]|uniref:Heat shock protein HSP 90-alpha n=1 Tax=Blattamonas nauphoetae TaxID=2049346 RepID=A0ABQ9X570_9EUKA|nr:putative Heat shock protein HSP 90-alpha [Blattamonas nauphoetae]